MVLILKQCTKGKLFGLEDSLYMETGPPQSTFLTVRAPALDNNLLTTEHGHRCSVIVYLLEHFDSFEGSFEEVAEWLIFSWAKFLDVLE